MFSWLSPGSEKDDNQSFGRKNGKKACQLFYFFIIWDRLYKNKNFIQFRKKLAIIELILLAVENYLRVVTDDGWGIILKTRFTWTRLALSSFSWSWCCLTTRYSWSISWLRFFSPKYCTKLLDYFSYFLIFLVDCKSNILLKRKNFKPELKSQEMNKRKCHS